MRTIALFALILASISCTTVPPGYVGIRVNYYGGHRGVDSLPIQTGRVGFNPITETVYEYPVFIQTVAWTKDEKEGAGHDQSITFNSIEGAVLNADVSMSYSFEPSLVPHLFVEFTQDAEHIRDGYLRTKVRDAFARQASQVKVVDIFGAGKQTMLDNVKKQLTEELGPRGIIIDTVTFIGAPRADDNVMASINATIQATQRAIEAQNKVAQAEAEAAQQVATAKGEAESKLIAAHADAEANDIRAKSITPELLKAKALDKWNGVLPQVSGSGATPFITVEKQ